MLSWINQVKSKCIDWMQKFVCEHRNAIEIWNIFRNLVSFTHCRRLSIHFELNLFSASWPYSFRRKLNQIFVGKCSWENANVALCFHRIIFSSPFIIAEKLFSYENRRSVFLGIVFKAKVTVPSIDSAIPRHTLVFVVNLNKSASITYAKNIHNSRDWKLNSQVSHLEVFTHDLLPEYFTFLRWHWPKWLTGSLAHEDEKSSKTIHAA